MSEKEFLEQFIKNNPFNFKQGIINQCRKLDKLDVYEWVAEDELKIQKLQQENKQLKEDFKLLKELQMRTNEANQKYKEVIEEVRERIDIIKPIYKSYIWYNELERMLNKAKEVVKDE